MILPTRDGRHGCHLRETELDEAEPDERPYVRPKDARETSIDEALGVGDEEELPHRGQNDGETQRGERTVVSLDQGRLRSAVVL